eukprot:1098107-Pleurochrysis_carterae.AAC.1
MLSVSLAPLLILHASLRVCVCRVPLTDRIGHAGVVARLLGELRQYSARRNVQRVNHTCGERGLVDS